MQRQFQKKWNQFLLLLDDYVLAVGLAQVVELTKNWIHAGDFFFLLFEVDTLDGKAVRKARIFH